MSILLGGSVMLNYCVMCVLHTCIPVMGKIKQRGLLLHPISS